MTWHILVRAAAPSRRLARCIAAVVIVLFAKGSFAETGKPRPAEAADAVREALQREIYGLSSDRADLLETAAAQAPQYAPALWHRGYIQDGRRGWMKHEAFLQTPKVASRLAMYERQRSKAADTVEGQLALADWCAEEELKDQERAHLTRVIDLAPDHAPARARLGFVRENGGWIAGAEIAREREQELARRAALKKWQPMLTDLREGLEHRSLDRRNHAASKLREIHDPDAIAAIEAVFAGASDEVALPALDALAGMSDPEASLSLARFAVHGPTQSTREAAAKRLGQRELDSFVPQILSSMYSPVISRFLAVTLPSGRIGYRHAFEREAQDRKELMVLDTEYRRVNLGGSRRDSAARAWGDAARTARTLELRAAAQNNFTNRTNDRLAWVLAEATGEHLPADPETWWQWWNERNEVFVSTEKPTAVIHQTREVAIVDQVPTGGGSGGGGSGGGSGTMDCLAAGTLVWTAKGPFEIERIQVGDLVLSQHTETGELAYKPVLRTTIRPKSQLIKIEAGGETYETSGGHLFWVAGRGWVKSRELESGQILHSAGGPVHVSSAEPTIAAETYNLVVADFSTYFVGYRKVLSHDNTVRAPTRALVPGLAQQ